MRRTLILGFAIALSLAAIASAVAVASAGPLGSKELQAVRAAVAKYHDYDVARADGYDLAGEPCVSSPAGGMGIHAPNPALTRSDALDPEHPEILLYQRRADGSLELVGVEYWHIALANTPNGPAPWFGADAPPLGFFTARPTILGHAFDGPMAGHNPQMPWHYDLHVWVVNENPAGTFAQFNPAVRC
jgi:hypothetical protein